MSINIPRDMEVEICHTIALDKDFSIIRHYLNEDQVYVDNIYGGFDSFKFATAHREGGIGARFQTWVRARAIIYALTERLGCFPILAFLNQNNEIKGLGVSDDERYAAPLAAKFNYINTFFHTEPFLDVMKFRPDLVDQFDFIICTDVLEHIIGDWRVALNYFHHYLKPNGVLIFSVPCDLEANQTLEHYPGCIGYDVKEVAGEYLVNINYPLNKTVIAENPIFHGGPGNTLEMRMFSKSELEEFSRLLGFSEFHYYGDNVPKFGIDFGNVVSGIFAWTK